MTKLGLWAAAASCLVAGALVAPPTSFTLMPSVTQVDQGAEPVTQVTDPAPETSPVPSAAAPATAAPAEPVPPVLVSAEATAARPTATRSTTPPKPAPARTTTTRPASPSDDGSADVREPEAKTTPTCTLAEDRRSERAIDLTHRCKGKP